MRLAHFDSGSPPAVFPLHGFPLSREMWVEQIKTLGSTYRVIAPDLRGPGGCHDRSEPGSHLGLSLAPQLVTLRMAFSSVSWTMSDGSSRPRSRGSN
jgi:pimeloyl-ACP methyl ester carboxylesterase